MVVLSGNLWDKLDPFLFLLFVKNCHKLITNVKVLEICRKMLYQ